MSIEKIMEAIRDVPDFPKPGIIYKDITPLLKDSELFAETVNIIASGLKEKPDYIVGIEARGFILGAALALHLGCGFIPVRKKGKLPYKTVEESYSLEYGEATVEIHSDAVKPGEKVFIVDDVLATGGTASAAIQLLKKINAEITGISFLLELSFLNGRKMLEGISVNSLITV